MHLLPWTPSTADSYKPILSCRIKICPCSKCPIDKIKEATWSAIERLPHTQASEIPWGCWLRKQEPGNRDFCPWSTTPSPPKKTFAHNTCQLSFSNFYSSLRCIPERTSPPNHLSDSFPRLGVLELLSSDHLKELLNCGWDALRTTNQGEEETFPRALNAFHDFQLYVFTPQLPGVPFQLDHTPLLSVPSSQQASQPLLNFVDEAKSEELLICSQC